MPSRPQILKYLLSDCSSLLMTPRDRAMSWLVNMTLLGKKKSLHMSLRILKWGHCPGFSEWSIEDILSVLMCEGGRGRLHTYRGGEGGMETEAETGIMPPQTKGCQRMMAGIRSWKRQWNILPQNLWREHYPVHTLILDFWPQDLWENMVLFFKATSFVIIY